MKRLLAALMGILVFSAPSTRALQPAVELYSQDELIALINHNRHLQRVRKDDCQLVQDIEARAEKVGIPAYLFLWGDMLAWGVCVQRDVELGIHYMQLAASHGLPAALEQLGRYYRRGILVQRDPVLAMRYMRESASFGFIKAQIELAEMLLEGYGGPLDYEDAYRWLHHAVIGDRRQHRYVAELLQRLAANMPDYAVNRAKQANP